MSLRSSRGDHARDLRSALNQAELELMAPTTIDRLRRVDRAIQRARTHAVASRSIDRRAVSRKIAALEKRLNRRWKDLRREQCAC